jgi:hypothetical protein
MEKEIKIQKNIRLISTKRKAGNLKKRNGTEQCNLITFHGQPDHIIISVPCLKSEWLIVLSVRQIISSIKFHTPKTHIQWTQKETLYAASNYGFASGNPRKMWNKA